MIKLRHMKWIGRREMPRTGKPKGGGKAAGLKPLSTDGN
jgi:hypothetical protein